MGRMRDGSGHDSSCRCPQHGGPEEGLSENELPEVDMSDDGDDITLFDGDPV